MIAIGLDPGTTGAIAFVDSRGSCVVEDLPTEPIPGDRTITKRLDPRGLLSLVRANVPPGEPVLVGVEELAPFGGAGSKSTLMSMGDSIGVIRSIFSVLRVAPKYVRPQAWKRHFGLKADKSASLVKARVLYPLAVPLLARAKDHNRAEAVLIAHYILTTEG